MDRREVADMARDWSAALVDCGGVPTSLPRVEQLTTWIVELDVAMSAEPFDPSPAYRVGVEMVRWKLTDPH